MKNSPVELLRQQASTPGYNPLYGAPTLLLFTAAADAMNAAANCALAAENVILAATDLGVGTCYMGSPSSALNGPHEAELSKATGIPEGVRVPFIGCRRLSRSGGSVPSAAPRERPRRVRAVGITANRQARLPVFL